MSPERRPRQPPQRNPVLQAAVITGKYAFWGAVVAALIAGIFAIVLKILPSGTPSNPSSSPPPTATPHPSSPSSSAAPSPTPSPTITPSQSPLNDGPSIPINPNVQLNGATFCSWRFGTHPMPLAALNPPRVRIDDRCNYPQDPNPLTDRPTGVYSISTQDPSELVAQIPDGTAVSLTCYTQGETISDAVGDASNVWLSIQLSNGVAGYIPDVNIGGGYSQKELQSFGLSEC